MMRTLYAGVSGLKNHQIRMDVIGNNISNVNTNGFKSERVNFQDMISQLVSGASEPRDNVGGVNPKQVGLGAMVSSIDKLMHQGALQTTSKNTDLAISGEGFFVLADGSKKFYTRNGNFDVDKEGWLVNPANGMRLQGWNATKSAEGKPGVNTAGDTENLKIPLYQKEPAKETSFVRFKSNLNSAVQAIPAGTTDADRMKMIMDADPSKRRGHITSINAFDDQGVEHTLKVYMWKSDTNKWTASVAMQGAEQLSVDVTGSNGQNTQVAGNTRMTLGFSPDGRLTSVSDGVDMRNQDKLNATVSFRLAGNPAVKNIELRLGEAGQVDGITQFSSQFTTKAVEQDGYTMGYMEAFEINDTGVITGVYSNGARNMLGQVALANFTNPEGLTKSGQNNFVESINSGNALIGTSGIQGLGGINAGFLEMSNVDLADQFTDMIVTQRGFQANSRSITTADQMLQELLGLKR